MAKSRQGWSRSRTSPTGHGGGDDVRVGALRHAPILPAGSTGRRYLTHVVGRRHHLEVHDRLEQNRVRWGAHFHGHRPGRFNSHFARVNVGVRAGQPAPPSRPHGIAGSEGGFLSRDSFTPARPRTDVFPGNVRRHVASTEPTAPAAGLHVDDDVAVMAAAACLSD